jgi:hypothetical protein
LQYNHIRVNELHLFPRFRVLFAVAAKDDEDGANFSGFERTTHWSILQVSRFVPFSSLVCVACVDMIEKFNLNYEGLLSFFVEPPLPPQGLFKKKFHDAHVSKPVIYIVHITFNPNQFSTIFQHRCQCGCADQLCGVGQAQAIPGRT